MTYYAKMGNAAKMVSVAFQDVADSCRSDKTPMDTARALYVASTALKDMADRFVELHEIASKGSQ